MRNLNLFVLSSNKKLRGNNLRIENTIILPKYALTTLSSITLFYQKLRQTNIVKQVLSYLKSL